MRERAAVVCWNKQESKVLLMHRFKNGEEYYVVPGGGLNEGETFQEAAVRELAEEAQVYITVDDLRPICYHEDEENRSWYYYAERDTLDEAFISPDSPEAHRMSENNQYHLEWVPLKDVKTLPIWPSYLQFEITKHCSEKDDRLENVELTVMCLICDGDKILLQDRHKDTWEGYAMPGGHIERGESIVAAVKREIREETGLEVLDPVLCGVKQFPVDRGRYIVFLFKATKFKGTLVSSDEGHMEWIRRADIPNIKTVNGFPEHIKIFDDPTLSELQETISPEGEWSIHLY